jgi:hypothetical protein
MRQLDLAYLESIDGHIFIYLFCKGSTKLNQFVPMVKRSFVYNDMMKKKMIFFCSS